MKKEDFQKSGNRLYFFFFLYVCLFLLQLNTGFTEVLNHSIFLAVIEIEYLVVGLVEKNVKIQNSFN